MAEANETWQARLDRIERTMDIVAQEMTDAQRRADERMERCETGLEHVREIMTLLAEDHVSFRDEHKRLLIAQVVLTYSMKELAEGQAEARAEARAQSREAREAHKETRQALDDLINITDGIIRARPPQ